MTTRGMIVLGSASYIVGAVLAYGYAVSMNERVTWHACRQHAVADCQKLVDDYKGGDREISAAIALIWPVGLPATITTMVVDGYSVAPGWKY